MSGKRRRDPFPWILSLLLFFAGLGVFLYPYVNGFCTDMVLSQEASSFLSLLPFRQPTEPTLSLVPPDTMPEETMPAMEHLQLWQDMVAYNQALYEEKQPGMTDSQAFTEAAFYLKEYGLESEVFGVISIPAIDIVLPLYLGATEAHLADGAAQMGQTSLPIGGLNTNCVVAGHRGYSGASYFRFADQLLPGDIVQITNLWETLTYQVVETVVIAPSDVDAIRIQPGKDLLTLLTCHPYASGGKQRMLIICERICHEEVHQSGN